MERLWSITVEIPACKQTFTLHDSEAFGQTMPDTVRADASGYASQAPDFAYENASPDNLVRWFLDLDSMMNSAASGAFFMLDEYGMVPEDFEVDVEIEEVLDDSENS